MSEIPSPSRTSSGTSMPIACATLMKQVNPLRRHILAVTVGAADGDSARYMAAESSTASSAVTQEE